MTKQALTGQQEGTQTWQAGRAVAVATGDAYVKGGADGGRWAVGTGAVEQVFAFKDGRFRLASYMNKLVSPAAEYVDGGVESPFFELAAAPFLECSRYESLLATTFARRETIHPIRRTTVQVREGDVLVFRADRADDVKSAFTWNITLDYEGAPGAFTALQPGEASFYTLDASGALAELPGPVGRIPGRADFDFGDKRRQERPSLLRLWKAPRAGTINIGGSLVSGSHGDLAVSIQRLLPSEGTAVPAHPAPWTLEKGECCEVAVGGRPAAQLNLTLRGGALRARLHVLAFPGTSILRHWMEVENAGTVEVRIDSPAPFFLHLGVDPARDWTNCWMTGADSSPTMGVMRRAGVGGEYHNSITSSRGQQYMPWMALERGTGGEGLFVSSESLCDWNMTLRRRVGAPALLAVSLLSYADNTLKPGARLELPPITTGVFIGGLDGMGMQIYDWQYQYLWDYTNPEYYARMQYATPWVFASRNLQEQFAYRLAGLDMAGADYIREAGIDMLWDDAGWAKYPTAPVPDSYGSVFHGHYDGPDFSMSQRFLDKMGATWLVWFCGRPSAGVMDAKAAAWGPFQWRTDGVGSFTPESETAFRANVQGFLDRNPTASFHTCDGGSVYAHAFGIQRLADLNYLSDFGRGDEANYNFSYLDTPDKWTDILEVISEKGRYNPKTSRHMLTMVPNWAFAEDAGDRELLRRNVTDLYHYLRHEGVAGRWSYVFHPVVEGDRSIYYLQRSNHERTKSLIILKHCSEREVTVFPRGLLPGHAYVVGFDSTTETTIRSGSDLMATGIRIAKQVPGDLIYLGLADRPGASRDQAQPGAVGRSLACFETNLGHPGVGVYWTAVGTGRWISYYEVQRDGVLLGMASIGCYYFDHTVGWSPAARYAVRAVGGNGVAGPWQEAEPTGGDRLTYHALGGHFSSQGRDGWGAETSADEQVFTPMGFVAPVKNPAADVDGGTPNQIGGVEGYYESGGGARIGRGWQRAAMDAVCARTWTAPRSGRIRVLGRAMKECFRKDLGTAGLPVEIRHGAKRLWQAELVLGCLDGARHDLTLAVEAGDVLRFVLGKGGDPENDLIAWMPKIIYDEATAAAGDSVVRIACGSGIDATDGSGRVWSKDMFHQGGEAVSSAADLGNPGLAAEDGVFFQTGREGTDFTYRIPVRPGLYALRLKFAETATKWMFERPMDVQVNGRKMLEGFDVRQAVREGGPGCDRSFRHIVPDSSGFINLRFTGVSSPIKAVCGALVRAIEILPESRAAVRIACGSTIGFIDWNTDEWIADTGYQGGVGIGATTEVKLATPTIWDQGLYRTARSGREITYTIPMPPGLYTVQLKFAELWLGQPGTRPMDISINGRVVRRNWDPALAAGELGMATGIRVEDIAPDHSGSVVIRLVGMGGNDAVIQAIEIR